MEAQETKSTETDHALLIRAARTALGVSQSRFATLIGVSVRTVQDWEQSRRTPLGTVYLLLERIMDEQGIPRLRP